VTDRTRPRWVLAAMCLSIALMNIDVLALSVALPDLQRGLNLTDAQLQWSMNSFLLALTVFLITGGRLGDMYGRKRMFLVGLGVFLVASLFSGLAQSAAWLIAARAVQGVGYAIVFPLTLALLAETFAPAERPRVMGTWGAAAAIGDSLGPLVGGVLVAAIDWRAVFFINIPIGLACFALTALSARESRAPGRQRLDVTGLATLTVGLTCLVVAITEGTAWGWGSPATLLLFGVAVTTLAVFALVEARVRQPLIPLRLFRSRIFNAANAVGFLLVGIYYLFFYQLALYFQLVEGFSPARAGLAFLPFTLAAFVGSQLSGRVMARYGARLPLTLGSGVAAAALLILALVQSNTSYVYIAAALVVLGIGFLFAWSPLAAVVVNSTPRNQSGAASGANIMFRNAGGTIALAVGLALSQSVEAARLAELSQPAGALTAGEAHDVKGLLAGSERATEAIAHLPAEAQAEVASAARLAEVAGFTAVMWMLLGFALACLVIAWLTLGRLGSTEARSRRGRRRFRWRARWSARSG